MKEPSWPDDRMYASAHVLIGRGGQVWKLVEFDKQAYHAGASILNGRSNCNRWTLGIELMGTQDSGFTDDQYKALAALIDTLQREHGFPLESIAGHDTVRWAAIEDGSHKRPKYDPSGRKDGKGDNFDWGYLWFLMGAGPRSGAGAPPP
jgi:N-acetyl-anhydromuramyl-L-alanine amidase AmpD